MSMKMKKMYSKAGAVQPASMREQEIAPPKHELGHCEPEPGSSAIGKSLIILLDRTKGYFSAIIR